MVNRAICIMLLAVFWGLAVNSHANTPDTFSLSDVLAAAVAEQMGVEGNTFTHEQLKSVTELTIENAGRLDLTGIAHLPLLKKLELRGNFISNIEPLSALTELTHLDLSDNRIDNVTPLKALSALTYLNLNGNLLVDGLSLANLSGLRELRVNANAIEDLRFLSLLTHLSLLDVSENRLDLLNGVETLDQLSELYASQNSIVDLSPLSRLKKLKSLDLSVNRIQDLSPLASITTLESLVIHKNPIRSLIPVATLSGLTRLSIASSRLDGNLMPLSSLPDLAELRCSQSHIEDLEPLKRLKKLAVLDLHDNRITSIQPLVDSRSPFVFVNLEGNPLGTLARTVHVPRLRGKSSVNIDGEIFRSSNILYSNFAEIDRDQNKVLSYEEAQRFASSLSLTEFDALDMNHDWALSSDELVSLNVILPNSMELVWVGESSSGVVSGTQDSPFETLGKAREAVKEGGTIVLTPGATLGVTTFTEPVTIRLPDGAKEPGRIGNATIPSAAPKKNSN